LFALTPSVATQRKLALYRNVQTFKMPYSTDRDAVLKSVENLLQVNGVVGKGDMVVVTWGEPMGQVGGTNAMKIVKIGDN
ncbi:MAG: pyruvate kinase alpha/beta domain-containing protein, partial [Undibacterium sp.]|nr:pyruvate kinase alpha/beta domain-containing protein [Undibacterium sp.]